MCVKVWQKLSSALYRCGQEEVTILQGVVTILLTQRSPGSAEVKNKGGPEVGVVICGGLTNIVCWCYTVKMVVAVVIVKFYLLSIFLMEPVTCKNGL